MKLSYLFLGLTVLGISVGQVAGQNSYPGFYGENGAGGIYLSVDGGPESGPAPALLSVSRTNSNVYTISGVTSNWVSAGTIQTVFINPNLWYYFDLGNFSTLPTSQLSNLFNFSPIARVWFSTNAGGIWYARATNRVASGAATNTYRLEISKTREQRPTFVSPNELPVTVSAFERTDPTVSVGSANGDGLQFQWQRSDAPGGPWTNLTTLEFANATNEYLQLFNVDASSMGYFRKYIYNSGGSITSTYARVQVILGPPAWSFGSFFPDVTNRAGYPALTGNGSGIGLNGFINNATKNWGYWRQNGEPRIAYTRNNQGTVTSYPSLLQTNSAGNGNIAGFNLNYLLPTDSGLWDCVVFDAWGRSMTSPVVRIVITNAPGGPASIIREPLDATNVVNGAVNFIAGATGAPPVTVQWYRADGTPLSATASNYVNATATNLTVRYLSASDAGGYYMVATDLNGTTATSRVSQLSIALPPTFLVEPVDATGTEGGPITFTALGTANVPFRYQWLFNGSITDNSATNSTYTRSNLLDSQNKSKVSVQLISQYHTVISTQATISVTATGYVATYKGQPWVRVLDTDTRVPGYSSFFSITNENIRGRWNTILRPRMTLKNRTLHMAVPSGVVYYSNSFASGFSPFRSLTRWRSNQLDVLIYTNTPVPGTSDRFADVFYPTDEEEGIVNFVGFGSSNRGVYEIRGGVVGDAIPSLITPYSDGPGFFDGSGQLVRRGTNLVFASNSTERKPGATNTQIGIFRWDGTTFTTLLNENTDLPGAASSILGVGVSGFAGDALAYDGVNVVANIVSYGTNGGIYLITPAGLSKVADRTDRRPGAPALFNNFGGVAIRDGRPRFSAFGSQAFAVNALDQLVVLGPGAIVAAPKTGQTVGQNGTNIRLYNEGGPMDYIFSSPPNWIIDGRRVQSIVNMVAEGDDVAIDVQFTDGSSGVYINADVPNPPDGTPVTISGPVIVGNQGTITFATQPGKYYRVERASALATGTSWNNLAFVVGDGNVASVTTTVPAAGVGYFRVVELR